VIDQALRAQLAPSLDRVADRLAARDVPALGVTAAGLLAGLGACVAVAESAWALALVLWSSSGRVELRPWRPSVPASLGTSQHRG